MFLLAYIISFSLFALVIYHSTWMKETLRIFYVNITERLKVRAELL